VAKTGASKLRLRVRVRVRVKRAELAGNIHWLLDSTDIVSSKYLLH
jgi:hypothetical protein